MWLNRIELNDWYLNKTTLARREPWIDFSGAHAKNCSQNKSNNLARNCFILHSFYRSIVKKKKKNKCKCIWKRDTIFTQWTGINNKMKQTAISYTHTHFQSLTFTHFHKDSNFISLAPSLSLSLSLTHTHTNFSILFW